MNRPTLVELREQLDIILAENDATNWNLTAPEVLAQVVRDLAYICRELLNHVEGEE